MVAVAPGLWLRPLGLDDVLAKFRARHLAEVARHNAGVVERLELERIPPLRAQVLGEFTARARSLAR